MNIDMDNNIDTDLGMDAMLNFDDVVLGTAGGLTAVRASTYTFDTLAAIYNQARIDYIVPMPMNAARLIDYVLLYDVKLEYSAVVENPASQPCGIIMLGIRGTRTWITRLGVIPNQRNSGCGRFMMDTMLNVSRQIGASKVQLEVIVGNVPAINLFQRVGFTHVRELLVLRRPPGQPSWSDQYELSQYPVMILDRDQILSALVERGSQPAWTEEMDSLLHVKDLRGLSVTLSDGERGWVIFQIDRFQISHITLSPRASLQMAKALLVALHTMFVRYDTKTENIARADPYVKAFEELGYIEVFGRVEMEKAL